jgi:hypothetical protein
MSQDFSVFVIAQIRGDLEAMRELAIGALALLDAMRDQLASAEATAGATLLDTKPEGGEMSDAARARVAA